MLRVIHDALATLGRAARGDGPAVNAHVWPHDLRGAFPGARRIVEAWTGEGAAFARYATAHGPLFLKYLPWTWHDLRACTRLEREAAYLRDLAPLSPVPHAPHLHSAVAGTHAHLVTRDLTDGTTGWGAFTTDAAREAALLDVIRLLARHHAHWAGPDGRGHPAMTGMWAWRPADVLARAARLAAHPERMGVAAPTVRAVASRLPDLLTAAPTVTLAHGDVHAGQVLWPTDGDSPVLIDYGQTHPSVPGEDLAHLLTVRLDAEERTRLGPPLRDAYHEELARCGLNLSRAELHAQERAGLALNVLTTVRQAYRCRGTLVPTGGVADALARVLQAWEDAESTSRNAR